MTYYDFDNYSSKPKNHFFQKQNSPPSYDGNHETSIEINYEDSKENKGTRRTSTGLEPNIMNMISINGIIMAKYLDNQVGQPNHH